MIADSTATPPPPRAGEPLPARVARWLEAAGVPFRVLQHAPVFTSEEAARVRGTPLEAGAKALVVRADERHVHVVLPGDRKLDSGRLRAILGVRRIRFATPDELLTLTGCAPGAVPPLGNLFGLPVVVDVALAGREEIAFNAGSREVSVVMRGPDLVRLAQARVERLTSD